MRKFLFFSLITLFSIFSFSQEIFALIPDEDVIPCTVYLPPETPPYDTPATSCPAGTTRQTKTCSSLNKTLVCTMSPAFCCSIYPHSTQTIHQQDLYNACISCSRHFVNDPENNPNCDTLEEVTAACAAYTAAATAEWEGASKEDPCSSLTKESKDTCRYCMYGDKYPPAEAAVIGFWTGIGCISTNPMGAISQLTTFLLGVVGVFIFFQILIGAFTLLTSKGSPQAVQSARERITNSIIALLLIIFSVTILQFVGVNILHIPGFFDN